MSRKNSFLTSSHWRGRPYLISPFADIMLSGGFALIVLLALIVFLPASSIADTHKLYIGAIFGYLAFAVNDPHFIISYQLLYRNFPEKLRKFRNTTGIWLRYLNAGIIVPLTMGAYFLYALVTANRDLFAYSIIFMVLIVVWHYTKQAFGVFMMLSALKKVYYSRWQRRILLGNCYIFWVCFSIGLLTQPYTDSQSSTIFGISYTLPHFALPEFVLTVTQTFFLVSGFAAIIAAIWDKRDPQPSKTALLAYTSMYYLLLPAAIYPLWIAMYPLFHSMQYLMFVYAYKRGETHTKLADAASEAEIKAIKKGIYRFIITALLIGVISFWAFPGAIEYMVNADNSMFLPVTAAFVLFINIHHYFIDNVIWRRENKDVGAYLFHRPHAATV